MCIASTANGASMDASTLQLELQFARCMSNQYRSEQFTLRLLYPMLGWRCVSFPRHPLLPQRQSTQHRRSQLHQKPQVRCSKYELPWSMECSTDHCAHTADEGDPLQCITPDHTNLIISIQRTVAQALLPTLRKELDHLATPQIIRRTRESEVWATCGRYHQRYLLGVYSPYVSRYVLHCA